MTMDTLVCTKCFLMGSLSKASFVWMRQLILDNGVDQSLLE